MVLAQDVDVAVVDSDESDSGDDGRDCGLLLYGVDWLSVEEGTTVFVDG